jgi:hypothetical protein
VQVTIRDNGDLKAVGRALREAANGKELRKQLTRELKHELAPMVASVKAAWRAAPSSQGRSSRRGGSLRSLLARATRAEVRLSGRQAGIRVRTDGRRMPSGMKGLPGLAEGLGHAVDRRRGRWRHPVFGDRDTWVSQRPFPGQPFYSSVQPHEARVRREVEQAVEAVFKQIVRAR